MPIERYSLVKGRFIERRTARRSHDHYQVWLRGGNEEFRLAINAQSRQAPPDLLFLVDEDFDHPITNDLRRLAPGAHALQNEPGGLALDYVRGGLFDYRQMTPLPRDEPGPDNDLNERLDEILLRAGERSRGWVCAWGSQWGPSHSRDAVFRFHPSRGLHNIHMNQGAKQRFRRDNGPWQDGGLIVHLPQENRWAAVFLAFQSQTFRTDAETGAPSRPVAGMIWAPF